MDRSAKSRSCSGGVIIHWRIKWFSVAYYLYKKKGSGVISKSNQPDCVTAWTSSRTLHKSSRFLSRSSRSIITSSWWFCDYRHPVFDRLRYCMQKRRGPGKAWSIWSCKWHRPKRGEGIPHQKKLEALSCSFCSKRWSFERSRSEKRTAPGSKRRTRAQNGGKAWERDLLKSSRFFTAIKSIAIRESGLWRIESNVAKIEPFPFSF